MTGLAVGRLLLLSVGLFLVVCFTHPRLCQAFEGDLCLNVDGELVACPTTNPPHDNDAPHHNQPTARRVAIVGGGVGGSSAAYFLQTILSSPSASSSSSSSLAAALLPQKQRQPQQKVEVVVYERQKQPGGRVQDVELEGVHVEVGGSIYHGCNKFFRSFVHEFGLTEVAASLSSSAKEAAASPMAQLLMLEEEREDDTLAVWNGRELLFRTSEWQAVTLAKVLWRYGLAPFRARALATQTKDRWLAVYDFLLRQQQPQIEETEEERWPCWKTTKELMERLEVFNLTQKTLREELVENGVDEQYIDEIITAGIRVNYGQNTSINAFAGYVSMLGAESSELYHVKEGNNKVIRSLLSRSGAEVRTNTAVTSITRKVVASNEESTRPRFQYVVKSKKTSSTVDDIDNNFKETIPTEGSGESEDSFDAVIIAAPLELAGLEVYFDNSLPSSAASLGDERFQRGLQVHQLPPSATRKRPYQVTHTTFVAGIVEPEFFQLANDSVPPFVIMTTETPDVPFSSLAGKGRTNHPSQKSNDPTATLLRYHTLYKIFSRQDMTEEVLSLLFRERSKTVRYKWSAYTQLQPFTEVSLWPDPVLDGADLYYINAFETVVSTIETETVASRNVVHLLLNSLSR
ncbi:Prenylcysteine oxidase-like [Balamuthia mandrillaris]